MTRAKELVERTKPSLPDYDNMRRAIAKCWIADECKGLVDKAHALAAYYKQIKDEESERRYMAIKLRAWRQMALIISQVDLAKANSMKAKADAVRAELKNATIAAMTSTRLDQLIKLGQVKDEVFEKAMGSMKGADLMTLLHLCEGREDRYKNKATADKKATTQTWQDEEAGDDDYAEKAAHAGRIAEEVAELGIAPTAGMRWDPQFKIPVQPFLFNMWTVLHEQLRKAAFDKHTTMHSILRQALDAWFKANGYKTHQELLDESRRDDEAA